MIARPYLRFLLIGLIIVGWNARVLGENNSFSDAATDTPAATAATDAKPAAHKSSHKKKKKSAVAGQDAAAVKNDGTVAKTDTAVKNGGAPKTDTAVPKNKTAKKDAAGAKTDAALAKKTPAPKNVGPPAPATAGTAPGISTPAPTAAVAKNSKKKSHSKKHATASTGLPAAGAPISAATPPAPATTYSSVTPPAAMVSPSTAPVTVTKSTGDSRTQITISAPPVVAPPAAHAPSGGPEVETGLPVARHSGNGSPAISDPIPGGATLPRAGAYQLASAFPVPPAVSSIGTYTPRTHLKSAIDNFTFTNFTRHVRNVYPWKFNIITTVFWIGEGSTPISSTTNVASAWDQDWRSNNGGSDTPNDRSGYMPAHHAARVNPFYVALPFNDLAFPDKARRWLPAGWYRPSRGGKQVSACQNRWLEIKNAQGETCYAQWEDVGPLRYDHAEYVFGEERPDTYSRAGLDVSPAVADYLNITGKNCLTRWRFVDDADVQPGMWLKYDEEALIFKAMHDVKEDPTHVLPIERATAPIDDDTDIDSNKKRLGAAKG